MKMETSEFLQKLNSGELDKVIIVLRQSYGYVDFIHNNESFERLNEDCNDGFYFFRPSNVLRMKNFTGEENVNENLEIILCDMSAHSDLNLFDSAPDFKKFANDNFCDVTEINHFFGLYDIEDMFD